jgi:phage recombination protein Bet
MLVRGGMVTAELAHVEGFTPDQVNLIKRTIAIGATNDELALFLHVAQRSGLDPLARQIHFVKRQTKDGPRVAIQTGIDGYRLIADRTGCYAGNDDPVYEGELEIQEDDRLVVVPEKATVVVFKLVDGQRCPFTASARWTEYYPGARQGFQWRRMPYLMLGKTAEALALRKAFPAELSGVYTDSEMDQAQHEPPRAEVVVETAVEDLSQVENRQLTSIPLDGQFPQLLDVVYELIDKKAVSGSKVLVAARLLADEANEPKPRALTDLDALPAHIQQMLIEAVKKMATE